MDAPRSGRAGDGTFYVECPRCKERINLPAKFSRFQMEEAQVWLRVGMRLHDELAHPAIEGD